MNLGFLYIYSHTLLAKKRGKLVCKWKHYRALLECGSQILLLKKLRDETRIDTQRRILETEIRNCWSIYSKWIHFRKNHFLRPRPNSFLFICPLISVSARPYSGADCPHWEKRAAQSHLLPLPHDVLEKQNWKVSRWQHLQSKTTDYLPLALRLPGRREMRGGGSRKGEEGVGKFDKWESEGIKKWMVWISRVNKWIRFIHSLKKQPEPPFTHQEVTFIQTYIFRRELIH